MRIPLLAACLFAAAFPLESKAETIKIEPVVSGVSGAWGLAFLPDGGFLFTLKEGRLMAVRDGEVSEVSGMLAVADVGQGGLLDVMVPQDFSETREVFWSFSRPQGSGEGTALAKGRISEDLSRLDDVEVIFELAAGSAGGRHFGSRVVEGADGTIYLTIGDRGDRPSAQDLSVQNGSVVRVNRDGSVPADNPFVGQTDARPEIWSYGHRNPQGATLDASGQLWTVEHGAKGGDEINRIEKGANYGWPVISYGTHYSGRKIGEGTERIGMEQPAFYWDPSMAPSGMMIYSGKLWPDWAGDMFVGSLKFSYIARLDGAPLTEVEQIETDETARVRDIREAPDGAIWFISEGRETIYRMTPGD